MAKPSTKNVNQVTRCTVKERDDFSKASKKLGWPDPSALVHAVMDMTVSGKLEIKPPAKQPPTVKWNE